jgi:CubicO group peptidase (beta-lactamase class C family)
MTCRVRSPFYAIAALLAALAACGGGAEPGVGSIPPGSRIEVPADPNEQFALAAPAEVGMDEATLAQAVSALPPGNGISGLLVMRHGRPVMERYWNGYDKDTLHDMRSATKSITSLLVGIAIDRHDLGGVDDALSTWLAADYPGAPVLSRGLVLENLLTMRSGLACNDWDGASQGSEEKMYGAQDWVRFWLDLPSPDAPDTVTSYCSGNPVALGQVVANATHGSVPAFAQANLFGPLGITSARWNMFDNGTQTDTGGHLHLRPRDMLRIGRLALQGGAWNGTQVVSSAWIAESTRQHTQFSASNLRGYGYLWWHGTVAWQGRDLDMFFADGAGGQYIFVVPGLDLVAVFTGENYAADAQAAAPLRIMGAFIVAAVQP